MNVSVNRSVSVFIAMMATLAAASTASAVSPASAAPVTAVAAATQPSRSLDSVVTVRVDDLNTASVAGSRTLYARISAAARAVCDKGAAWYPGQNWALKECIQATVDDTVAKLHIPALTALHLEATRRRKLATG